MASRWKSSDVILKGNGKTATAVSSLKSSKQGSKQNSKQDSKQYTPFIISKKFSGVIIGVDPSLRGTGLAVIRCEGKNTQLLHSQTVKTKGTPAEALAEIAQNIAKVCEYYAPNAAAVEEAIFAQNHKTALTLGAARGAVIASLTMKGVESFGFPPARTKMAVVGYGRASKQQVSAMVKRLLQLPEALPFDEADAAATALCLLFSGKLSK